MKPTSNTILITGGGSGIGRGLAEAFHTAGNLVVISGRTRKSLDETTAANPGMKSLTVDMGDATSIKTFAGQVAAQFPSLNVLVNNAGIMRIEDLTAPRVDLTDSEAIVTTNLLGPIRLTAALLPLLRNQPEATVMTVSSGLGFVPLAQAPTYCATKAAIHSYSQSLRYQLKDTTVRVIELIPPYVQTTILGEQQATDERAMPLAAYIAEVMNLLKSGPTAAEIGVKRVQALRYAAEAGRAQYDDLFQRFNDTMKH